MDTDDTFNSSDIKENIDYDNMTAHTLYRVQGLPTKEYVAGLSPQDIKKYYCFNDCYTGDGVIAIVGAYDYPTALNDFNVFSEQFGLPLETSTNVLEATNNVFQVINAEGSTPETDAGWAMESALDIQWAHALAPTAKIILLQAASNTFVDLFQAVDVANAIPQVKVVSMSWGGAEWSTETIFDIHMKQPGVIYVAGAGDVGGQSLYPSVSQYVVSAGGTKLNFDKFCKLKSETAWVNGGGGPSLFVPIPDYQAAHGYVAAKAGSYRGTPDVAIDADPASGVAIYDSTPYNGLSGWTVIGGTSFSAPAWAGIINLIGEAHGNFTSTNDFLNYMYTIAGNQYAIAGKNDPLKPKTYFRDIVEGQSGSFSAAPGWDFCTGLGAPIMCSLAPAPPKPLKKDVINLLLASIAFEELGLSHIINSEAEKIQYIIGTLPGHTPPAQATIDDLLKIDCAVQQVLKDVIKNKMLLQFKLEDILTTSTPTTPTN